MINKPPHNRFLLSACDEDQYCKFVSRYQKAKKYGIRAVVGYLSGAEIYQIVGEIGKGALRRWGRKKLAPNSGRMGRWSIGYRIHEWNKNCSNCQSCSHRCSIHDRSRGR